LRTASWDYYDYEVISRSTSSKPLGAKHSFEMKKKVLHKQQGLSPLQVSGLNELSDIYIKWCYTNIANEKYPGIKSNNGEELLNNLKRYGLSHKRFFQSLEKRIIREFSNVEDAHFEYEDFLSTGVYILYLTYAGEKSKGTEDKKAEHKRTTKLSRNTCPALFNEYELGEKFKRKEISTMDILHIQFEEVPNSAEVIAGLSSSYCRSTGLTELNEQERLEAFVGYQGRAFSKLYNKWQVYSVSSSFTDCMEDDDIHESIEWDTLYDLVGECSGILAFPEGIMEYVITKEGDYMRFIYNDYKRGRIMYSFESSFFHSLPDDEYKEFFIKALKVLIMKRYGKVETYTIEGREQRRVGNNYVVNKAPFPIHRLDGSWFKTIIRTNGFGVKGHWRLQACGKGWKERKLIYISGFQKHGYVRRAPALAARAVA